MKKLLVHMRIWLKAFLAFAVAAVIIISVINIFFKPTYSVTLDGEFIGYTNDKAALQDRINEYIKSGDGEHIAFVQIETLPEYKLCLLKKNAETNDDEIFERVKTFGTTYYKYYLFF